MKNWIKKQWCSYFHGGGTIERDSEGRINWRCAHCGRWSDMPVSLEEEIAQFDKDLLDWQVRHGKL